jgi:hypothetical protein
LSAYPVNKTRSDIREIFKTKISKFSRYIYLKRFGVNVIVLIRLATIAKEVFQKVATPTSTIE